LFAQEYPTKPINLTVGVPVGGTVDLSARILASKAEKVLGQPIAVSNNGGGAGSVALELLAKTKPDGYQLVICPSAPLVEVPQLRKVPYKVDAFIPVMQYTEPDQGLVVQINAPWNTFKEFVDYAKKNPGKVTYSIAGTLTPYHLAMMYVAKQEGIQWTAIPIPGGDPNMPLLGGHVTAFTSASSWKRYIDQGKFKLLVTYGDKRMTAFPNIPTLKELGYDFVAKVAYLVVAPAGTPAPVVKKLHDAFKKAMDDPEFIEYMKKAELPIVYANSADTKKNVNDLHSRFAKMIVELNIPREQ